MYLGDSIVLWVVDVIAGVNWRLSIIIQQTNITRTVITCLLVIHSRRAGLDNAVKPALIWITRLICTSRQILGIL